MLDRWNSNWSQWSIETETWILILNELLKKLNFSFCKIHWLNYQDHDKSPISVLILPAACRSERSSVSTAPGSARQVSPVGRWAPGRLSPWWRLRRRGRCTKWEQTWWRWEACWAAAARLVRRCIYTPDPAPQLTLPPASPTFTDFPRILPADVTCSFASPSSLLLMSLPPPCYQAPGFGVQMWG